MKVLSFSPAIRPLTSPLPWSLSNLNHFLAQTKSKHENNIFLNRTALIIVTYKTGSLNLITSSPTFTNKITELLLRALDHLDNVVATNFFHVYWHYETILHINLCTLYFEPNKLKLNNKYNFQRVHE